MFKHLLALYADIPACDFSPMKLKAVRQRMVEAKWSRRHVNKQVGRLKHLWKWAAENELVGGDVCHSPQAVSEVFPIALRQRCQKHRMP